jgi:hypothetical protein
LFCMFSVVCNSIICLHWCAVFDFGILSWLHLTYYRLYIIVPYVDYRTWNHLQFGQLCLPWIPSLLFTYSICQPIQVYRFILLFLVSRLTCNIPSFWFLCLSDIQVSTILYFYSPSCLLHFFF